MVLDDDEEESDNLDDFDEEFIEEAVFLIYPIQPEENMFQMNDQILDVILNNYINGNNEEIDDENFYISPNLINLIKNNNYN